MNNNVLSKYKLILWDFDGVIIDSNSIRENGFREVLSKYQSNKVEKLIKFHNENGGLSRYVKFKYFYEHILKENLSEIDLIKLTDSFSKIMVENLTNQKYLIQDSVKFISEHSKKINMFIVSGSDNEELNFLCEKLNLKEYFINIYGSPTPKTLLVNKIIDEVPIKNHEICLIGDSINDLEAAQDNDIVFFGYNNLDLKKLNVNYIESFS